MTNPNYLEVAVWEDFREVFAQPDAFTYRPERGYRWLQKAALWVLRKLGAYQLVSTTRRTYSGLQDRPLRDRIFTAVDSALEWRADFNGHKFMVVIGRKEAGELLSQPDANDFFGFYTPMDVRHNVAGRIVGHVHNVPIVVCPWLNGFAVVPQMFRDVR